MRYELQVEEIMEGQAVDLPDEAKMANLTDPNELGIMELTYLAPVSTDE